MLFRSTPSVACAGHHAWSLPLLLIVTRSRPNVQPFPLINYQPRLSRRHPNGGHFLAEICGIAQCARTAPASPRSCRARRVCSATRVKSLKSKMLSGPFNAIGDSTESQCRDVGSLVVSNVGQTALSCADACRFLEILEKRRPHSGGFQTGRSRPWRNGEQGALGFPPGLADVGGE